MGQILFIIYINDLETWLKFSLSNFTDKTKLSGKTLTTADWEIVQKKYDQLIEWSEN